MASRLFPIITTRGAWRTQVHGPWPTLLMRQPYGRDIASTVVYAHPVWFARQGYHVVIQDVRGRGGSEGEFYAFRNEGRDGAETIAWLRQHPACNGRIGMYGFSYQGSTQLLAAAENPEGLVCIAPHMTAADLYHGWFYHQGALRLGFDAWVGDPDAARGCAAARIFAQPATAGGGVGQRAHAKPVSCPMRSIRRSRSGVAGLCARLDCASRAGFSKEHKFWSELDISDRYTRYKCRRCISQAGTTRISRERLPGIWRCAIMPDLPFAREHQYLAGGAVGSYSVGRSDRRQVPGPGGEFRYGWPCCCAGSITG
jgi:hypothetical protein